MEKFGRFGGYIIDVVLCDRVIERGSREKDDGLFVSEMEGKNGSCTIAAKFQMLWKVQFPLLEIYLQLLEGPGIYDLSIF